jgi:Zn-dependent protease
MLRSSYRITSVWGIPIKIHISLIVLLALFVLPALPSMGLAALIIPVGLFTSVALHELGHSYVALKKGCRVREITLMFIGGAAQMEEIPSRPADEFQMAIAGPLVSLGLGLLLWFGAGALPFPRIAWPLPIVRRLVVCNMLQAVGVLNLGLAAFNLLPAFPMDGGRVFRALLAHRMGRLRATFIAARLGKIMAVLFGIRGFFFEPRSLILVAIAFFIYAAAGNEYRMVQMQEAAKRGWDGFGFPFFGGAGRRPDPVDDDAVSVSPPPYARGPGMRADLYPEDEDEFRMRRN